MTQWKFNPNGWTDWITHDGKGCPCVGWYGRVEDDKMQSQEGVCGLYGDQSWDWSNAPRLSRIIRYRIRKPKGAEMLERICQDTDTPIMEEA